MQATARSKGDFSLDVHEQEATSYLAAVLPKETVTQATLWFSEEGIYLRLELALLRSHELLARLGVHADGGLVRIRVQDATLDGRHLPRFLLISVEEAANDALADMHLPLQIREIALGEGYMTVHGAWR